VTNVTFSFVTSPNTNPKTKLWGNMAYYVPPVLKSGGTRPRVPHQIAPMREINVLLKIIGLTDSLACHLCGDPYLE